MVRLANRNPLTTADHLTTIEGLNYYFSEFSGVKTSIERPDYSDGLTTFVRKAASGSVNYADVTLKGTFDPEVDGGIIAWAENAKCALETSDITVRPVQRCNGVEQRGTKAWRLTGCRLKEFSTFENMDTKQGNATVMVSLTLTVEQAEWV